MESNERIEDVGAGGPENGIAPRQFRLFSSSGRGGVVVRAFGRLALGHGASEDLWEPHLRGARRVSLDLTGVTELDARGLGVLAALALRARQQGVALSVVGASRVARSLASLVRLDQVVSGTWDNRVPVPGRCHKKLIAACMF